MVFPVLLLALIVVPLAELYVLLSVGHAIGAGTTILVVILTAILGAWLLRLQGYSTLARVRDQLHQGTLPSVEIFEGLILLVVGALLLTPGFITDTVGFAGLIPALRRRVARAMLDRLIASPRHQTRPTSRGRIIDGDYRHED